jgi:hypothetical protein
MGMSLVKQPKIFELASMFMSTILKVFAVAEIYRKHMNPNNAKGAAI